MAKKTGTKAAGKKVETDQYFEGMEPPKIAELDRLMKALADAKVQVDVAATELELAEDRLQKAFHKNAEKLEKDVSGNLRYLCKAMQMIATLKVKEAQEVVKLKEAPRAKAPAAE